MRYFVYMGESTLDILDTPMVFGTFSGLDAVTGSTRDPMWGERTYYRPIANEFGYTYSEVLQYTYSLIKCRGEFTDEEQRKIERWLTSPRLSRWLEVRDTEDPNYITKYYGAFTQTQWTIGGNGFIGVTFTFQTNAPYPWISEHYDFDATDGGVINFTCNSDELETPLYPKISMSCENRAEITVTNLTDGNNAFTINMLKDLIVIMDCQHNILRDETTRGIISYRDIGWDDVDNIYWPKIYAGSNSWRIAGADVHIEIDYNAPFKRVGGWL